MGLAVDCTAVVGVLVAVTAVLAIPVGDLVDLAEAAAVQASAVEGFDSARILIARIPAVPNPAVVVEECFQAATIDQIAGLGSDYQSTVKVAARTAAH